MAAPTDGKFLSTPSARRATSTCLLHFHFGWISIHALREEGDPAAGLSSSTVFYFYPRPPRGGRPLSQIIGREPGIFLSTPHPCQLRNGYFYPRPPRGGRPYPADVVREGQRFLSTPSARRATIRIDADAALAVVFLSTPSARRATSQQQAAQLHNRISIHALREEGDCVVADDLTPNQVFLSTPSARRATALVTVFVPSLPSFLSTPSARRATDLGVVLHAGPDISIHALREEGDRFPVRPQSRPAYFYPRPPRGGRLQP